MTVTELHPETEAAARAEKTKAEAEALRAKTRRESARDELAQERARVRAERDVARERDQASAESEERREERRAQAAAKERARRSAETWRRAARAIAIVCVVVSLPLQIMAFWDPHAWFLVAAPFVLEGVAWALLCGAQAAIDDDRPSWHYRLGALIQALIAAGINYAHGSAVFGAATGVGGALCSLLGPVIWDLHEHGRIAKKLRGPSRAERRAERRKQKADNKRAEKIQQAREEREPEVWKRALDLAAALGETLPTEKTYRRAWSEIHGTTDVGATADRITAARAAKRAVKEATYGPVKGSESDENPQVDSQMTPADEEAAKAPSKARKTPDEDGRKKNGGRPPVRRAGTVRYTPAARRQMSITAGRDSA